MSYVKFILLICNFLYTYNSFALENCQVVKATFDVGSAATKMIVAKVDICRRDVVKQLLSKNIHIPFKSTLAKNRKREFDKKIIGRAIDEIKKLKKLAVAKGAISFDAVATASFREAKNGKDVAIEITEKTGVNFSVITQEEEAKIGYRSAILQIKKQVKIFDENQILVWDIGGGSMQITSYDKHMNSWNIYKGKLASVSFRNIVISKLQKKSIGKVTSPNPLSDLALVAVEYARRDAEKNVSTLIKKKAKLSKVFGIGGVHYYSIRNQCSVDNRYTQTDLMTCLDKRKELGDKDIGGKYATTDITNIALVLGHMKALKINEVIPIKANMSYGIFFK